MFHAQGWGGVFRAGRGVSCGVGRWSLGVSARGGVSAGRNVSCGVGVSAGRNVSCGVGCRPRSLGVLRAQGQGGVLALELGCFKRKIGAGCRLVGMFRVGRGVSCGAGCRR